MDAEGNVRFDVGSVDEIREKYKKKEEPKENDQPRVQDFGFDPKSSQVKRKG